MYLLLGLAASPAMSSRRVLCLHGSGGSARTFVESLHPLRDAASQSAWEFDAIDAPLNGRWWTYPAGQRSFTADSYEGAENSIAAVEDELKTGRYCGILGFSQGAMLATIVAARAMLGESDSILKFAVMCGGATPKPYETLLKRLRLSRRSWSLPTLHCLSSVDTINPPSSGEVVASCFNHPKAEILWHDAGHTMPPRESLPVVVSFMDRHG